MLVKGKAVIGLNVVTVDTGSVIQTVKDISYNPNNHKVEALFVKSSSLFSAARAIDMNDVINIGEDAVIVSDLSVIKSVKEQSETIQSLSKSKKYLVKTNVLTAKGKELGKITDIYFDSATGNVESMEVSQGGLKTLTEGKKSITPSNIVTIGADATIVSTYTEHILEVQGENAGLKGAVNDVKSKAAVIADNVTDATNDATEKIKDTSRDARRKIRKASKDAAKATEIKLGEAKESIQSTSNQVSRSVNDINNTVSDSIHTTARSTDKVVEQTKEKYEDATKNIQVEKTKIVKK